MANGPMSLAQESKARAPLEPKLKVQGQTVVAGQPSHERIETRELELKNSRPESQGAKTNKSRLGSQGQEVRAKESEPNRAKKANTREKVVAGQPDNPSTESGPKNPSFLRETGGWGQRDENAEPRPEKESGPESQGQKLKDSKSKTATQGQKSELKDSGPQNQDQVSRDRRMEGQGQRIEDTESRPKKESGPERQGQEDNDSKSQTASQGQKIGAGESRPESQGK